MKNRNEYKYYLKCDYAALGMIKKSKFMRMVDPIWKYQKLMRKLDYISSCQRWRKISILILKFRYLHMEIKLGFSIPFKNIGPGLCIAHYGNIVISHNTFIGSNCKIHSGVNIGATNGIEKAPQIGNRVYIGPGAKLVGDITITDDVVIGANAVVTKSITEKGTYAGVPARKISDNTSEKHIQYIL